MRAIKRDVARNIRAILGTYDEIEDYVVANWGLGLQAARGIADWYWRTYG